MDTSTDVHSDDDKKNRDSLISRGMSPSVVASLSADRRKALVARLGAQPVKDRAVFAWLMLCFAIIAMAALISAVL
jgi:hypothetical protein